VTNFKESHSIIFSKEAEQRAVVDFKVDFETCFDRTQHGWAQESARPSLPFEAYSNSGEGCKPYRDIQTDTRYYDLGPSLKLTELEL